MSAVEEVLVSDVGEPLHRSSSAPPAAVLGVRVTERVSRAYLSRPSKAETGYSAFVTKNLLPPVVSGLHLINTRRRFRQLHPPSSISEKLGSALGISHAFGQR